MRALNLKLKDYKNNIRVTLMIGSSRHRRRVKKNGPIAGAKLKEAIGRKKQSEGSRSR